METNHGPTGSPSDGTDYISLSPSTTGRLRLLTIGPFELNLDGKQLRITGKVVQLPLKEFDLLTVLMDNAGRVMSRRELLDTVWEPGHPDGTKTLDVHIKRLREHLSSADPTLRQHLRTVRGLGYVFDIEPE